jgi:hypothetical protein
MRICRRFWRNVERLMQRDGQAIDSGLLWNKIAYAPFLRTALPPGMHLPSSEMWAEGRTEYVSLMRELAPDCVLGLGRRLFRQLAQFGTPGPDAETLWYTHPRGRALVAGVLNPLAPGFAWQTEALKLKRVLTLTKLTKMF